ncbi:MAG TPA: BON domain-containing protein [Bryobacteraceae bacterium]|nr:BON domain-containing protein [Bryobacteraceae bacterium]
MLKKFAIFLLLLTPVFAESKKDDEINDSVRRRLAGDPEVKGGALEVTVENGVVTIKGIVRTEKAKSKADKVAMKVKGVTKVVNELKVSPTGN